jgi:multidrug efflux system outer membrane protein
MALLLGGCAGAPYRRPDVPVPPTYRADNSPANGGQISSATLGELRWQDLIHDEELSQLIQEALSHNLDAQIAAARVLEARAQLTISHSARLPAIDAQAGYNNSRLLALDSSATSLSLSLAWELDLWGRIRNMNAAARAGLLASEQARRGVLQSLVSDVVGGYFQLRDLNLELAITQHALTLREDSLGLVRLRVDNGYSSEIDLREAEVLVESAHTALSGLELQMEQTENALDILLGRNPGPIIRGKWFPKPGMFSSLPPGLPSTLLNRRPDILQAEQELIASHALVEVARAAYFPTLSLTSSSGVESSALHNLFSSSGAVWSIGPAASLPVFHAGSIRAGVRAAEARQQQALLLYRQTIQQAFREVADALVNTQKLAELHVEQERLVESLRVSVELADLRYRGGVASYLEYLDSERQLLSAQLLLVQVRRQELTNVVTLYKSLGGGWQ